MVFPRGQDWQFGMGLLNERVFGRSRNAPRVPDDKRIYAIGDIHGEAALLDDLLGKIKEDQKARPLKPITLIFLGDLIDRGPNSNVILRAMVTAVDMGVIMLKGNHEQALVHAYRGDDHALEFWLEYGGLATLRSFGIQPDGLDYAGVREAMQEAIDAELVEWLDARPLSHSIGDYFFVHAGIRPGVPLDEQKADDMLWMREPFFSSRRNHGKVIVHGHTIISGPVELGGNRICLDTGGHEFGRLTALGLEGEEQWLLKAVDAKRLERSG